jgi:DNA-nicking Smr family endonuclease
MERRHRSKISRGQWSIDSALDLHGMRQDEAHDTLRDFLFREHARGSRLVLVVTGVGRRAMSDERSPWFDEPGVLRRQTPHWLRAPDIRHVVMGFETASANHGGVGALYVRLRGSRR